MDKKLILIAEDEPYIREIIKAMSEEIGDFDIVEAENGKELLDIAQKTNPDLIITDIIMPDMDAYHAVRELKNNLQFRNTPVIFESAQMKDMAVFDTLKPEGPCLFLIKPFKFEELKQAINELLEKN